jgi:hypothetical protein
VGGVCDKLLGLLFHEHLKWMNMFMAYVPVMALLEHLKSLRTSLTLAKSLILSKVDYAW